MRGSSSTGWYSRSLISSELHGKPEALCAGLRWGALGSTTVAIMKCLVYGAEDMIDVIGERCRGKGVLFFLFSSQCSFCVVLLISQLLFREYDLLLSFCILLDGKDNSLFGDGMGWGTCGSKARGKGTWKTRGRIWFR